MAQIAEHQHANDDQVRAILSSIDPLKLLLGNKSHEHFLLYKEAQYLGSRT